MQGKILTQVPPIGQSMGLQVSHQEKKATIIHTYIMRDYYCSQITRSQKVHSVKIRKVENMEKFRVVIILLNVMLELHINNTIRLCIAISNTEPLCHPVRSFASGKLCLLPHVRIWQQDN